MNPATVSKTDSEVQATGKEVPPRDPKIANPIYLVRWGNSNLDGSRPMEILEFSKVYSDPTNPQSVLRRSWCATKPMPPALW
jgi:hypothetical protein